MGSKKRDEYAPSVAIPPGYTIRENMQILGMDQEELAERLGITAKHLSNIINGKAALTYDVALRLETVIGPSAEFWMNLEEYYRLDMARLAAASIPQEEISLLDDIPYMEMIKNGWIEIAQDCSEPGKTEIVNALRRYFAVASLCNIKQSYALKFRKQRFLKSISNYGALAWLRRAEILGFAENSTLYNKNKLKNALEDFLCEKDVAYDAGLENYKAISDSCGVTFVTVEHLSDTNICYAVIRRGGRAILALDTSVICGGETSRIFPQGLSYLLENEKSSDICYTG